MKKEKLDNYLRAYRKQSGLTQKDITFLLGNNSIAVISKMENGHATPSLEAAIYLSILYRQSIATLFPALIEQWQFQLLQQLDTMNTDYAQNSPTHHGKRIYLEAIINDIATASMVN